MKPAPFRYLRAASVGEAVSALVAARGDARILAGGQSLVPAMNFRMARPALLVDVNAIPGLDGIRVERDGALALGALVRHADLVSSPVVRRQAPMVAEAARHIGHRAIRNRGTLGGSLAHADPAAELPAVLVALEGEIELAGPPAAAAAGQVRTRRLGARDFFLGVLQTALEPAEIIVQVSVPPAPAGWGFAELARRPGDFALAGVAAALERHPEPRARLAAFGAGPGPVRLTSAERSVMGDLSRAGAGDPDGAAAAARRAGEAAARDVDPPADVHASAAYRRHLVSVLA